MTSVIVLAMHGMPPTDFPRQETSELFGLNARLARSSGDEREALAARRAALDAKMRGWPRNDVNDPYHAASYALGRELAIQTGKPVVVGFNEFCAPSLAAALDEAASLGDHVVVLTPMLTRGGDHSEKDIPEEVEQARRRHPGATYTYVWPMSTADIAAFFAAQAAPYLR